MRHAVLHQADAGRSVVKRGNADFIRDNEVDVTVESTVHIEVAYERHQVEALGVVDTHEQRVFLAVGDAVGNLEHKGAVSAYMLTHVATIDEDIGHVARSLKAKEKTFALPFGADEEGTFVVANAAFVVKLAGECILGVPGVW